jgi:hypothetical protein
VRLLQQFAHQPACCRPVPPTLDEDLEHFTFVIDGPS